MKIFTLVFALFFSVNLLALEIDLKGHWVFQKDLCKSGATPSDRWTPFQYHGINLFIYEKDFHETVIFQMKDTSNTCYGGVSGSFSVEGETFTKVIKLINQDKLERCGIVIQAPLDTPIPATFERKGKFLYLNKISGGEAVCNKAGDLIEVYELVP